MKRGIALVLALALLAALFGCAGERQASVELTVFAAASLTESMDQIIERYKDKAPDVAIVMSCDSSGTLKTQIQEGAACDMFLSAAPKQMEELDAGLGLVLRETRVDLLENKVVLVVPEGNPKGIGSFDQLARMLEAGDVLLAMGNSDVPVGQYTRRIFAYYGLEEDALAASGVLTYGSNVKEVAAQVGEGMVDCGIVYATDACSAGLTVVDEAGAELCGQVLYPAAVLSAAAHENEARAFLEYLQSDEAMAIFQSAGFAPAG